MYCSNCGTQNDDQAMFCKQCGKPLSSSSNIAVQQNQSLGNGLAICALVFSIIFAIVGIILSIIAVNKYPAGTSGKTISIIALVVSIINCIIGAIIFS